MEKNVCVTCKKELRVLTVGIVVLYFRGLEELPFKACHADIHECPQCRHMVVVGFGTMSHEPIWEHATDKEITSWRHLTVTHEVGGGRVVQVR